MLQGCVSGAVDVDVLFTVEGQDIVAFDVADRDPLPLGVPDARERRRQTFILCLSAATAMCEITNAPGKRSLSASLCWTSGRGRMKGASTGSSAVR